MAFAIAKRAYDGESAIYVTAIKRCWSSIDNARIWDNRLNMESWKVRTWVRRDLAEKALALIADIGGYDDYSVVEIYLNDFEP